MPVALTLGGQAEKEQLNKSWALSKKENGELGKGEMGPISTDCSIIPPSSGRCRQLQVWMLGAEMPSRT